MALAALAAVAGCGGRTIVGGGVAHSYGSVAVPGYERGTGLGVEVGHYRPIESGSVGVAIAADLAGYSGSNDGDAILWSELQGRYRRELLGPGQPGLYFALGPGIGYTLGVLNTYVASAFLELGYELRLGSGLALDVSLRERPAFFQTDEYPFQFERGAFHNTLMLGLDLVIGSGAEPAR